MEDEQSAKKRKRPTKRKAKCDKLFPCGTCLVRNEPDQCEYDEGSTPPPQHAYVAQSEFMALQARVARLEGELKSISSSSPVAVGSTPRHKNTPYNHPSTGTSSSTPAAADVEPTIHAIEILATNLFANAKKAGALYGTKGADYDKDAELVNSASSVWPSIIDPLNTRRMSRPKWTRGMTDIMTALPRREVIDAMFHIIMEELQMPPALSGQMIPTSIFKEELQQFHMLRDIGQHCAIDAGWLSHLAAVLWFVVGYCIRHPKLIPPILQETDLQELGVALYEAFETALYCAEAMFRPQLRVFMALLMAIPLGVRGPGLTLTPYANTGTRVMLYDLAVGIVKGFGMNQLEGPESGVELPRDPALPRDKPRLSWQLLSRTFGAFVFLDSFAMAWMPGHTPAFDTPLIHTNSPLNIDVEELLQDDNSAGKPLSELTDTTWEIHMAGMSKAWRRILQYLALPDEERTYPRMLEIDAYARLCFDHIGNMEGREKWDDVNKMTWHALRSGWMQRFLRLHRPWLVKSIESDSKEFEQSYDTCLNFSTTIVRNHRYVIEHYSHTAVSRDFVPIYSHHLSAVIVLFIIGLLKPSMRADMMGEIRGSLEVFRAVAQPDHDMYARVGPKGYGVIRSMIQILESPASSSRSFDQLLAEVERQAAAAPAPNMPSAGNIASIVMNPMLQSLDSQGGPGQGFAKAEMGHGTGNPPMGGPPSVSSASASVSMSVSAAGDGSPASGMSMSGPGGRPILSPHASGSGGPPSGPSGQGMGPGASAYLSATGPQSTAAAVAMGAPPSTWTRDDRGFAVPMVPPIYPNAPPGQRHFSLIPGAPGQGLGPGHAQMTPVGGGGGVGTGYMAMGQNGIGYDGLRNMNGNGNANASAGPSSGGANYPSFDSGVNPADNLMQLDMSNGQWFINPDLSLNGMDFDWDSLFKSF